MVAALVAATLAASAIGAGPHGAVVVTDPDGRTLARLPLGADGDFALRYRNSLYGTRAEERFSVAGDGNFNLVELAAEQLAVLEEYYAVDEAPRGSASGWWTAAPSHELELDRLRVAATDLGQRSLIVPGQPPLDLWRLVPDSAPSVLITVDGGP